MIFQINGPRGINIQVYLVLVPTFNRLLKLTVLIMDFSKLPCPLSVFGV